MGQTLEGLKVKHRACMSERKETNEGGLSTKTSTLDSLSLAQSLRERKYVGLVVKKYTLRALVIAEASFRTSRSTKETTAEEWLQ